ncbi:MAG: hypothetical protein K8S97_10050 [Anaerolineae bacterium]|nr:hypothetical protein [Anaerolineae bacterium]
MRAVRLSYVTLLAIILLSTTLLPVVSLAPARAEPARRAQPRPALSGDAFTYGTTHFLIHYTFSGIDAIDPTDTDNDNTPDWVAEVAAVLETVWRVEVDQLGWPAPLPDNGEGGDTRFDVYLMELFSQNLAGYVSPNGGFVGDNPYTPREETSAAFGFMVLENDYVDPSPPNGLQVWPPEQWLRIIAAHEFNHMLQIAITGNHWMRWWYEATANWMETMVFPNLPDNVVSARAAFKSPDTCMLRYGGVNRVENGLHWYGMWVFQQMLTEEYGADLVLDIWFRMADTGGYGPWDDGFAARGTTFEDEVRRFGLSLLLRDFRNGDAFPAVRLQEAVDGPGTWNPVDGVQRYAMDFIGLNLDGVYSVTVTSDDDGIEGVIVGVKGDGTADVFAHRPTLTVDFSVYDHAYLMVVNTTRPPNEAGCATARYTYTIAEPAGDASPIGPSYSDDATHFTPPRVEAVTDPEDIVIFNPFYETEYNIREEIGTVDLPFSPITPRGAPEGYELDSVYGVNADDVGGDFVALNAPSGGVVAQMLYYHDAGQLIRITQSPSIYVTIGEWLAVNRLEFAPGTEIWTTGGVDTAIVSPSRSTSGPFMVVFIVRERFMAIDGDADIDDMLDMAARFAASFGMDTELPEPRQFDGVYSAVLMDRGGNYDATD